MVKADLDDVESLKKAFAGAYAVYGVTNFWEHFSGEKEKAQAKNIADAAKAAGVKHVIWSTLEDTRKLMKADDKRMPMLQEKYRVPHFDAKAEANAYFAGRSHHLPRDVVLLGQPLLCSASRRRRATDGVYSWTFPMGDSKLAGIAAEDIGKVAYGIFKGGQQYIGKTVGIAGENLTLNEMSDKLAEGPRHRQREVQRRRRGRVSRLRVPRRRRDGQHVPGLSRLRKGSRGRAQHRGHQGAQPVAADFDTWVAKNKEKILPKTQPAPAAT